MQERFAMYLYCVFKILTIRFANCVLDNNARNGAHIAHRSRPVRMSFHFCVSLTSFRSSLVFHTKKAKHQTERKKKKLRNTVHI
uniref:Putative secreted protein n=1 Tax=Anopheles darlingi TaxID=43151 RepID=A0A2M4D4A3_ANODA